MSDANSEARLDFGSNVDEAWDAEASSGASGWMQQAKEKVSSSKERIVETIERNPYRAIAIAAGIGFVAGLILKRR